MEIVIITANISHTLLFGIDIDYNAKNINTRISDTIDIQILE